MSMNGEGAVVYVAFGHTQPGDSDNEVEFISVHATREGATTAAAAWCVGASLEDLNGVEWQRPHPDDERTLILIDEASVVYAIVEAAEVES